MSKANPKKAVAALLPRTLVPSAQSLVPSPEANAPGTKDQGPSTAAQPPAVRPMTLGMYAALERIGSPLVTGEEPKDILDLIPSLYLMTHDPREILEPGLLDRALAWADTQSVAAVAAIRDAALRQMGAALDVVPEPDDEDGGKPKKKRTAGSPSSSTGAPRPTTGASTTYSGESPSPPSASSAGRRPSRRGESSPSRPSRRSTKEASE